MKSKQLEEILKKVPKDKTNEAELIAEELRFVLATTEKLRKDIEKNGAVEHFINGKQDFLRESPAMISYNKLMKTYNTLYKSLLDLIPKEDIFNEDVEEIGLDD